jgi:hypothetical protein
VGAQRFPYAVKTKSFAFTIVWQAAPQAAPVPFGVNSPVEGR